jgi:hypothetical protein
MFFRVLKEGHVLVYEPRAIVRHRHRRSMEGLRSQIADHGVSFSAYIVRNALRYPDERLAFARLAGWWWPDRLPHAVAPGGRRRCGSVCELRGCIVGLTRCRGEAGGGPSCRAPCGRRPAHEPRRCGAPRSPW